MMYVTKPEVVPDGLYGMGQAAAALGINRSTLRKYANDGLIRMRVKKCNGRRYATGRQIVKLWEDMYVYKRHLW